MKIKHMTIRPALSLASLLVLSGCFAGSLDLGKPDTPQQWTARQENILMSEDTQSLRAWWKNFNDPVLDQLVETALADSPDRLIAEARILEARGLRRSARGFLFPQIGASAQGSRIESGSGLPGSIDDYYEAGFDASFEIDIFGKNRNTASAADAALESLEAEYHSTTLSLIAETVRSYIDYRAGQEQARIAEENLTLQEKTLTLVDDLNRLGEAPRLDVERASSLVNTTRASIPEFRRQADNARLRLSVLTGALPETLQPILSTDAKIPASDAKAILMSPAQVLTLRPDMRAAEANLRARTDLAEAATAEFFPTFSIGGFFGISEGALLSNATIWNVVVGAAVNLLDFGRIEGQIDAARAREMQAYQLYRKTTLQAVTEVETALTDYAHINERTISLQKASNNAGNSLSFSQTLFKEGEISFLDVLDSQRGANNAQSALITAKAAQAESLTRLYKSLGVY